MPKLKAKLKLRMLRNISKRRKSSNHIRRLKRRNNIRVEHLDMKRKRLKSQLLRILII